MEKNILAKYAEVLVKSGVNLQKDQILSLNSSIATADFAREIVAAAYRAGASRVLINWADDAASKLKWQHESEKTMCDVPAFSIARSDYLVDKKVAHINVLSGDPDLLSGIDPKKIAAVSKATRTAGKRFSDAATNNEIRWCIAAYPDAAWAKKLFPKSSDTEAVTKLWELIEKAMRLDKHDPAHEWAKHDAECKRLSKFLNDSEITSFHYKNSSGTDFSVGMPKGYIFCGGSELAADGVRFMPNLPTQEIFSAPHKDTAEGTLASAMPLVYMGNVIEDFTLTFKKGKVVDFSAKKGYDVLKGILDTDDGAKYLGEIALVGYDTPIQKLKTLFYETLFDENASCHFALGSAYPMCVEGGEKMSEEERNKHGLNTSLTHIDFMVGTADLEITAATKKGAKITIFKNGNFAI